MNMVWSLSDTVNNCTCACVMQGVGINGFDLKQKYPFVRGSDVAKNAESKDSAG